MGMNRRFIRVDLSLIKQRLDPAVIVGELLKMAVTKQVGTTVADVRQSELGAVEKGAGHGRPHPVQRPVRFDQVGYPVVGLMDGTSERLEHFFADSRRRNARGARWCHP